MRIAMISKADRFGGGASRVAEELCVLLQSKGHTAHHYVSSAAEFKPYMKSVYGGRRLGKFVRLAHHCTQRLGLQELVPWEYLVLRLAYGVMDYDLVHFHDLSSAISPLTVRLVARRLPTVWTFHDYAAFTGGCIFPMGCAKYQTDCGACPQMNLWPLSRSEGIDFTKQMLRIKRNTFFKEAIHVIAPSEWMVKTARSSGTSFDQLTVIPYGIDVSLYLPLDKQKIRQKLGLTTEKPVVLVSAGDITDKRKGTIHAIDALTKSYPDLNPVVLVVGKMETETKRLFESLEVFETGYLKDDKKKGEYFAAANVFLFCPLDDNMPLTILETMATETPMVGYATGGIPEVVEHQTTGYLAHRGDVQGVVEGLKLALLGKRMFQWGAAGRLKVEAHYSHEIFLANHLKFYTELIVSSKSRRNQ
jgi:glycosyltransferase involved in cell wall biosynthesis